MPEPVDTINVALWQTEDELEVNDMEPPRIVEANVERFFGPEDGGPLYIYRIHLEEDIFNDHDY